MTDTLTVLRSQGRRLAKRWNDDGTISGYEDAARFDSHEVVVKDINDLAAALVDIEQDPLACVIRGRAPTPQRGALRRSVGKDGGVFADAPHHWVMIDADHYDPVLADPVLEPEHACVEFVYRTLPDEFHGSSFFWQLSGSAGHEKNRDTLKAHLWFWLAEPLDSEALRAWAAARNETLGFKAIDAAVFRTVQPHYTAAPVLAPGATCRVVQRSGLYVGLLGDDVLPFERPAARPRRAVTAAAAAPAADDSAEAFEAMTLQLDDWPLERVRDELLPALDPAKWCDDHDHWVQLGMALWIQGSGGQEWLDLWDEFSCQSEKYEDGVCAERWASFGRRGTGADGAPVTLRSLLHDARDALRDRAVAVTADRLTQAIGRINACTDALEIETKLAPEIGDVSPAWFDTQVDTLVGAIQVRVRALTTRKPRADTVKKWLLKRAGGARPQALPAPDWLPQWVFVTDGDFFFNLDTKRSLSKAGFDAENSAEMPLRPDGVARESAAFWAVNVWNIQTVDAVLYGPGCGAVFEMLGRRWANTYREDSVPDTEDWTHGDGAAAVARVQAHLEMLFPDARERGLLLSWMAHNVRHPGRKVIWAPYVHGPTGAGKTFLSRLLSLCMGPANVREVSNSTLHSTFTPWVTGQAVLVLEEIHQTGKGYETADILKAPISNLSVDVHRKGKDSYQAPNFTNYMALSNHLDGVPIDETDRRWFFVTCALTLRQAEALGPEYFDPLFDQSALHAGALRAWLLECDLHPEFNPLGRAPKTDFRQEVIEFCKGDDENFLEAYLEGRDVVSVAEINARLEVAGLKLGSTKRAQKNLERAGFTRIGKHRVAGVKQSLYLREGCGRGPNEAVDWYRGLVETGAVVGQRGRKTADVDDVYGQL